MNKDEKNQSIPALITPTDPDLHASTPDPLNGLILAGGHSTRMGRDKSLLVYHDRPQREHLFQLLSECCENVFTSCRKDQEIPAHLNPIPDNFEIAGPLNGILSAFAFNSHAHWLVLAVDMPFVDASTLDLLISHRDQSQFATCFYNTATDQPEPLLTLWESRAYPLLLEFVRKGNISPREFLKTHPVKMIQPPDEKTLLNLNTPKDGGTTKRT